MADVRENAFEAGFPLSSCGEDGRMVRTELGMGGMKRNGQLRMSVAVIGGGMGEEAGDEGRRVALFVCIPLGIIPPLDISAAEEGG